MADVLGDSSCQLEYLNEYLNTAAGKTRSLRRLEFSTLGLNQGPLGFESDSQPERQCQWLLANAARAWGWLPVTVAVPPNLKRHQVPAKPRLPVPPVDPGLPVAGGQHGGYCQCQWRRLWPGAAAAAVTVTVRTEHPVKSQT
jgi:hypothetical protein